MTIPAETPAAGTSTPALDADEVVAPGSSTDGARLSDDELVAGLEAEEQASSSAPARKDEKKPEAKDEKKETPPAKDGEVEVKLDGAASKGIDATRRYREQVERQLQTREATVAKREADLAPRLAKLEAYEKSISSRDPLGVAEALGFGVDELETLSHTLYKLSKSASPADRAAAAQLLKQRDQRAEQQAFVAQYSAELTSAVADDHALVKNALRNAPKAAKQELLQVAASLEERAGGNTPTPAEVVKAYEAMLRRQAQAMGFDPSKLGIQDTTTTPTPEPGQKKTTATLTADLGPKTRSQPAPKSRDEAFEETERELQEMERQRASRRT